MNIKVATIGLLLGTLAASCSRPMEKQEVSILDLIVQPEAYQGRQVVTEGFLTIDEKPRLFVSRDDAIYKIKSNSVALSKTDFNHLKPCDQNYVKISGKFNQDLTLESLQYVYTKELTSKLLNPCWENKNIKG